MSYNIEDAIETLAGTCSRTVNIRLDSSDRNIITSIGKQVKNGVGLTDRQLVLIIKKIEKYKEGLESNGIDVDTLLLSRTLRMPLREIDRACKVYLDHTEQKSKIIVRYPFNKKLAAIWAIVSKDLIGPYSESKNQYTVSVNEKNLLSIISALEPVGFDIDPEITELVEAIKTIQKNSELYLPKLTYVNNTLALENVSKACKEYFDKEFPEINDENILVFLDRAKSCGINIKNQEITDWISSKNLKLPLQSMILSNDTRFRIDPDKYDLDFLFDAIDTLSQWPVLIILDEDRKAFASVKAVCEVLKHYMSTDEITVFFRLDNGQLDAKEFNHFVKENSLNNYIDNKTKVVFITKNRIPKPLVKADWKPKTAIVYPGYDYGKMSAYLNDFATVYYYNNSVSLRHNRIKGSTQIAEL